LSIQLIQQYHAKVEQLIRYGGTRNESTLRKPFQDLLEAYARSKNLVLVPEVEFTTKIGRKVYPDGTLKDALRQDWGFWESKDEKDDLDAEIATKIARGYPTFNILFEDTHTAVLYQAGGEVLRASFGDAPALDRLLTLFVGYEPAEVREFHKAIELFSAEVQGLADALREVIEGQYATNQDFKKSLQEFLELCRQTINPKVEMADVREMIIQHVLTEDIFMRVFDEADFHRDNVIAHKLQEVAGTFYQGDTKRNIHAKIAPFYEAINAKASQISDHHEKQKFLKALYGSFYRAYNPKAADRLGVIYTPDEIVRFMIESADHLVFKHFGKTLGDKGVEILDPATGTGTFITELIEYLPLGQLEYKYRNEIHCNEVAILPYYIANLNIEYTYKQKTGKYAEFENICFVDTLDNQGFTTAVKPQLHFFGFIDENSVRIDRQNQRRISVVIGNPPYNANQLNENENNKNREYPAVDKRIKETYIKHSTAQKTKLYDMYARFIRWASDRLDKNGVIAFVSNNSFINSRSYDGFRKVVTNEFSEIYIIDLKGDARTSGELRQKEGGNVFSDQIRVGIAVYFLVRKQGLKGCHIYYNTIADYATAEEKQDNLCDNKFIDFKFQSIQPDKHNNWINQSVNDWEKLIPIASKTVKLGKTSVEQNTVFGFYSLGVITARDEWVYDVRKNELENKIRFLIDIYNREVEVYFGKVQRTEISNRLDYSIKWTRAVKNDLSKGKRYNFQSELIRECSYRPFVDRLMYFSHELNEMQYQIPLLFPRSDSYNLAIAVNVGNNPFNILMINKTPDYHFNGDSQCFPFYRYSIDGEQIENITDWALSQFHKQYRKGKSQDSKARPITKLDVFHYVYAVLHHPAYRKKYEINLKREFPRIPFYEDFWQWARWGERLMDLHLNYEQIEPYPLERVDLDADTTRKAVIPRLMARKDSGVIEVDTLTTLSGVPSEAWEYRLGTYTALEWVLERYKEKKPKDPTIREKFNAYRFKDYKEQVIDLLERVCRVSVETVRVVREMPE
jgi:predicted helicase